MPSEQPVADAGGRLRLAGRGARARLVLIVNPAARSGRGSVSLARAREVLARGPHALDVQESRSAAHVTELAAAAAADPDVAAVVVCGGDGSAHAAVQSLVGTGKPMGLLPLGTGNDLARNLRIPRDPRAAAEVVLRARTRSIDVGRVTSPSASRLFNCVAGIGLDAHAIEHIRRAAWLRGSIKYTYGGLRGLLEYRPRRVRVEAGDLVLDERVMFVAVTNTRTYGGGMQVTPGASMDDGRLDVCVVERMPRLKMLLAFPRVYAGTHVTMPEVHVAQAPLVQVEAEEPLPVYLDGEPTELTTPVTIEAVPRALEVIVP